jgi:hypothetical protein
MPQRESDKVQREIEELLDKLDNFVPEERLVSKIRKRRKVEAGPNIFERGWKRVTRISLGHAMLAGLALLLIGTFLRGPLGPAAGPVMILGIALAVGAFLLSVIGGDSRRTIAGGRAEKRWRGQVIDYSEPSAASRLKDWFLRRRR